MMRRMPSMVRSTTSRVSRILARAERVRHRSFEHAEIQPDHHQRLPGFVVQFAADALALFFLRAQQMSGEFRNAQLRARAERRSCRRDQWPAPSGRQSRAADRAPWAAIPRAGEADEQHPDHDLPGLQRHSPQRLGPPLNARMQSSMRHLKSARIAGSPVAAIVPENPWPMAITSKGSIRSSPKPTCARTRNSVLLRVLQQERRPAWR